MPLIRDGALVDDPWVTVDDGTQLPMDGPAIVSLERWQAHRDELLGRNAPLGIRLKSDQPPALIADDLDRFAVVALEFPVFRDGRAYSYARLLRERYGYRGEVRAVGEVLRDQFLFMVRCGFDAIEVRDENAAGQWREAVSEIIAAGIVPLAAGPIALSLISGALISMALIRCRRRCGLLCLRIVWLRIGRCAVFAGLAGPVDPLFGGRRRQLGFGIHGIEHGLRARRRLRWG